MESGCDYSLAVDSFQIHRKNLKRLGDPLKAEKAADHIDQSSHRLSAGVAIGTRRGRHFDPKAEI